MTKTTPFASLILAIWMGIMSLACALTLVTTTDELSPNYDTMVQAANTAQQAMDCIKDYKISSGLGISVEDKLNTGMIGSGELTSITTTEGVLEAKRTTCNPNWTAVIIGMFEKAGLRRGDDIAMVFSSSFPAMNICVMSAAQAYGLNQCIMVSVGASYYGANQVEFTFFDMAMRLYDNKIFQHKIDYVSLGGADDVGNDFHSTEDKDAIVGRINASGVTFINEADFQKNINLRLEYLNKDVPNIKLLINVGGSLVGFGTGASAFVSSGFFPAPRFPSADSSVLIKHDSNYGLLQCMRLKGIAVASFINIKGLAETYGIPYDADIMPSIGSGREYYSSAYNLTVPTIALVLSAGIAIFYFAYKKTSSIDRRKDERNYILCRR